MDPEIWWGKKGLIYHLKRWEIIDWKVIWNLSIVSFLLFQSVYVEFLNTGICFSRIGRVYWPFPLPQSIFIGRCAHLIGHIKHEMMHTMGFYHEHSRSDRDDYINIEWDNISDGREDQFETYRYRLIKKCYILFFLLQKR